jgi:hypothetical protein
MFMKKNKNSSFLSYAEDSLPSPILLWLILLMATISVILFLGMGEAGYQFNVFFQGANHSEEFKIDPVMNEYLPEKLPAFYKLFESFYEIPFYQLLFGTLSKALLVILYFFLSWKITRSLFASLVSVFMIFGLTKFEMGSETILNLKIPFIPDSMEFRQYIYISFRQMSGVMCLTGTIFFLGRKPFASSICLALAIYIHPHNGMNFFIAFNFSLLFCVLFRENKIPVLKDWVKFNIPFLVITTPYILRAMSAFPEVEPISFQLFWELGTKIEPDDLSLLYNLNNNHPPYLLTLYITIVASILHFIYKSDIPKFKLDLKKIIQDKEDLVLPTMIAPWFLIGFGWMWESSLMTFLPDNLNTLIASLQIRRINMIPAILYTPIIAMILTRVLIFLFEKIEEEVFGDYPLEKIVTQLKKIKIVSKDQVLSLGLSILVLFYVLIVKNEQIGTFKNILTFEKTDYKFGLDKTSFPMKTPWFSDAPKIGEATPISSFLSVCSWIKKNTSPRAAFYNPTYIDIFRTCTKRQGFIEPALDGTLSIADRRYSTLYHQRFADIHLGLTLHDFVSGTLPLGMPGSRLIRRQELYDTMRAKYLSIDTNDINYLDSKYPGYRYFLTETSHELPFQIIYKNEHFLIYDLKGKRLSNSKS